MLFRRFLHGYESGRNKDLHFPSKVGLQANGTMYLNALKRRVCFRSRAGIEGGVCLRSTASFKVIGSTRRPAPKATDVSWWANLAGRIMLPSSPRGAYNFSPSDGYSASISSRTTSFRVAQ